MRSDSQEQDRFYELLEPELPRLQAFCQKLVGDSERGDDLVQDALYDAWRGFGRLRSAAAFKSWLYRIVINRYRTNLRRFKARSGRTVQLADDIADESAACERAARERLNIAMEALSAKERALVTLHELEGWSYSELTVVFGCSEGALRTRLTRCRRRMRDALRRDLEKPNRSLNKVGVLEECNVVKQERS